MPLRPPVVSVIMPVRNGAATLAVTLDSLLGQTLSDFEAVVVDDGSTDETAAILARYRTDSRVRVEPNAGRGIVAALRTGVARSTAPLLARLDADDLAYRRRLELQAATFAARPELVLLGTAVDTINWEGARTGAIAYPTTGAAIRKAMRVRNPFVHSTVMMRRAAYEQAGGYRIGLQMAEDYDLWLRLASVGEIANLPERLGGYRKGPQTYSSSARLRQMFVFAAARRCDQLRRSGLADPAAHWTEPLDLDKRDIPELRCEQEFFRLLQRIGDDRIGDDTSREAAASYRELAALAWQLERTERRLAQDMILQSLDRRQAAGGTASWRAHWPALRLGPWRWLVQAARKNEVNASRFLRRNSRRPAQPTS